MKVFVDGKETNDILSKEDEVIFEFMMMRMKAKELCFKIGS